MYQLAARMSQTKSAFQKVLLKVLLTQIYSLSLCCAYKLTHSRVAIASRFHRVMSWRSLFFTIYISLFCEIFISTLANWCITGSAYQLVNTYLFCGTCWSSGRSSELVIQKCRVQILVVLLFWHVISLKKKFTPSQYSKLGMFFVWTSYNLRLQMELRIKPYNKIAMHLI